MLVLSRKVGESFVIGDKIVVTVVRIAGGGVRLGIEAPADCVVVRRELGDSIAKPAAGSRPVNPAAKQS
jgi:carbon storage regulator